MLMGLTNAVNNNAVYMQNMELRTDSILKEKLRG